jgi:hypothetical protein
MLKLLKEHAARASLSVLLLTGQLGANYMEHFQPRGRT